jgi:EAL domain-containing protein (putative c-di-GMP-specific phosphodiesterase class I)
VRLPADVLKIDRSFVAAMAGDRRSEKIVRALCALGCDLGLSIIAEGVETATAAAHLASIRCDYAQGWLYAPALAPGEADRFLADAR